MKSDWAALLDQALNEGADTIPEGWLTYQQIAQEWQKSESHTRRLLSVFLTAGRAETKDFRTVTRGGQKMTPHFRVKPVPSITVSSPVKQSILSRHSKH